MSVTRYHFIPSIRRGLGRLQSGLTVPGNGTNLRLTKLVTLKVPALAELEPREVQLMGPGDVLGFDHKVIVRCDPGPDVGDYEPNYFPMIEFNLVDFPWMMSPGREDGMGLQPWISLIVLRTPTDLKNDEDSEGEFHEPLDPDVSTPVPSIIINNVQESLPEPEDLHFWAHAQVTTQNEEDDESGTNGGVPSLIDLIQNTPHAAVSRLLCPRRLDPGIAYTAFVVPTFHSGLLAGLGQKLNGVSRLCPAWDITNTGSLQLPYYYRWSFRTGLRGDFEHLVRLLVPRVLSQEVGRRIIDCSTPGINVDPPEEELPIDIHLEGALQHLDAVHESIQALASGLSLKLRDTLNHDNLTNTDESDYEWIVPPIYGCWHADMHRVGSDKPAWLDEINLDPRHRTLANFGTEVIQSQQDMLMQEAWRQIGAVEEANQRLREAQLAIELNKQILNDRFEVLPQDMFLQVTGPLHSHLIDPDNNSGQTIESSLQESALPSVVFDAAFRKITRIRGSLRKRFKDLPETTGKRLLTRMNSEQVRGAGSAPSPGNAGGISEISETLRPDSFWARGKWWKLIKIFPWILFILALLIAVLRIILSYFGIELDLQPVWALLPLVLAVWLQRVTRDARIADQLKEEELTPDFLKRIKPSQDFDQHSHYSTSEFLRFALQAQTFLNAGSQDPDPSEPADLPALAGTLKNNLDPVRTIPAKVNQVIKLQTGEITEHVDQIMATPRFPQPMYEALRDFSQDNLLPGLEHVHQNTIGLLNTNRRFIESYMAGLNVEFAAELLWREYPTDRRPTCFRQFWDVSEIVRPFQLNEQLLASVSAKHSEELESYEDNAEQARKEAEYLEKAWQEILSDITPIHTWGESDLGENAPGLPKVEEEAADTTGWLGTIWQVITGFFQSLFSSGGESQSAAPESELEENLVLLIRGQLLSKYPNAMIYAVKAAWDPEKGPNKRKPLFEPLNTDDASEADEVWTANFRFPIFKGKLKPDLSFFGFNLTESEARGVDQRFPENGNGEEQEGARENDAGWFFVIEERVSETRFGLDAYLETDGFITDAESWDNLSWGHLYKKNDSGDLISHLSTAGYIKTTGEIGTIIDPDKAPRHDLGDPTDVDSELYWGGQSANLAHITMQKPVRIAIHADDMMPSPENEE